MEGSTNRDKAEGILTEPNSPSATTMQTRLWLIGAVGIVGALGLVLPLLLAFHYGSIHSPSADDWAYDRAAFFFARTGRFNLYHWGTILILGQIVLAAPVIWALGDHVAALNAYSCFLGFLGLTALLLFARECGLGRWRSLMVAALCALCPLWATLSTSFMAEVPSFGFAMMALLAGSMSFKKDAVDKKWLVAALLLSFVSFSIREQMMAVELAIIATSCLLIRLQGGRWRRWACGEGILIAASLALYWYRQKLPTGGHEYPIRFQPEQLLNIWLGSWPLIILGLFALPVVMYLGPWRILSTAWRINHRICASLIIVFGLLPPFYHFLTTTGVYLEGKRTPAGTVIDPHRVRVLWVIPQIGNWYYDLSGSHIWQQLIPNTTWPISMFPSWFINLLYVAGLLGITLVALCMMLTAHRVWQRRHILRERMRGSSAARSLLLINVCTLLYLGTVLALNLLISSQNWDEYYLFFIPALYIDLLWIRAAEFPGPKKQSRIAGMAMIAPNIRLAAGILPMLVSGLIYTAWFESYMGAADVFGQRVIASGTMQLAHPQADNLFTNWMLLGLKYGDKPTPPQLYQFTSPVASQLCYGITAYRAQDVPSNSALAIYHADPLRGQWDSLAGQYVLVALPLTNNPRCTFTFGAPPSG